MTDQAPDNQKIIEGLEGLALKVVMLEEGDLPGLGDFLNHLENLQKLVDPALAPDVAPLFQQLEDVGNKLILQEITAMAQGQESAAL